MFPLLWTDIFVVTSTVFVPSYSIQWNSEAMNISRSFPVVQLTPFRAFYFRSRLGANGIHQTVRDTQCIHCISSRFFRLMRANRVQFVTNGSDNKNSEGGWWVSSDLIILLREKVIANFVGCWFITYRTVFCTPCLQYSMISSRFTMFKKIVNLADAYRR
jgi:hypothetical protein